MQPFLNPKLKPMNPNDSLAKVAEFHSLFSVPHLENPQIPSKERAELRVRLLQEELDELKEALSQKDLTEVADALCDLQYVLNGAILEFGMASRFESLFEEVHRSNLSKACKDQNEAEQTLEQYKKKGIACYTKELNGKFNVYRTKDDKVLKSLNYSAAELGKLLK